jgi:aspartate/methionine/tyrosine aminotransferase
VTIARGYGERDVAEPGGAASLDGRAAWPAAQIRRLHLAGRAGDGRLSVVAAERELEARARALGRPLLNLTHADTKRFPPPEWAIEAFTRAAAGDGPTYTPYRGDAAVRAALAASLRGFLGLPVDPESELILTPGTQAGLFTALASTVEPGDRVLLVDPDYISYERLVRYLGAEVDHVTLHRIDGAGAVDPEALRARVQPRTRLLVLSNPNNPTGAVLGPGELAAIAEVAIEHDLLVVVDELYARLVYDGRPFTHLATLEGMAERTVTLVGPSKTESLSGYRVGVALAPAGLVDAMEDVLSVAALRAPAYAQWTLVHWLRDDQEFVTARVAEYERLRDRTIARLGASAAVDVVVPGGTAYAFPSLASRDLGAQQVALALMEGAGVIVNPGYQFGPSGHNSFRICFAQEEDAWDHALDRILATLESLSG